MWCIYKITNKTNKLVYIGQTNNYENRVKEHLYAASTSPVLTIDKEIRQQGQQNFTFEILEQIPFQEQVNERERFWINYFNSYGEDGYNKNQGGYRLKAPRFVADEVSDEEKFACLIYMIQNLNGLQGNLIKIMWLFSLYKTDELSLSKADITQKLNISPQKYYDARKKLCEKQWLIDDINKDEIRLNYKGILEEIEQSKLKVLNT